jgi:hypothetical protein
MVRKYDDYEYHAGEAIAAGQPEENGFTHIGFIVSWLVRHDMGAGSFFGPELRAELRNGQMRPNDLRDLVDGKLLSDAFTNVGAAFLDAYYETGYAHDYEDEFGDLSPYSIPDDPEYQARIDRRIDAAYERWAATDRPAAGLFEVSTSAPRAPIVSTPTAGDLVPKWLGAIELIRVDEIPNRHLDPDLEARIAAAVGITTPMQSFSAKGYGSSLLSRALRNLRVLAPSVTIVDWLGPNADAHLEAYRLRGITADALTREFRPFFETRFSVKWNDIAVAGVPARHCRVLLAKDRPLRAICWCAIDGFVLSAGSYGGDASATSMLTAMINELGHPQG